MIGKGLVACHSICEFFLAVRYRSLIMPCSIVVLGISVISQEFFSICKADAILKELRPLVENKDDISVSITESILF